MLGATVEPLRIMNLSALLTALDEIKRVTTRVPATEWTPEFRETANIFPVVLRYTANHLDRTRHGGSVIRCP